MRIFFLLVLSFIVTASILCCEEVEQDFLLFFKKAFRTKRETQSAESYNVTYHKRLLESFKARWPVEKWRKFQYFTDDYLDLINEHWLEFSPPNETVQKVLGSIYVLFSTVGCWGNVMVLLMYLR